MLHRQVRNRFVIISLAQSSHFSVLKKKKNERMQEWEYLAQQQVVGKLFQIVQNYDFAEEVGRQATRNLLSNTIKSEKLSKQVLQDMFVIFENLQPNIEELIEEVALLIHEMREQEVTTSMPCQDQNFKVKRTFIFLVW